MGKHNPNPQHRPHVENALKPSRPHNTSYIVLVSAPSTFRHRHARVAQPVPQPYQAAAGVALGDRVPEVVPGVHRRELPFDRELSAESCEPRLQPGDEKLLGVALCQNPSRASRESRRLERPAGSCPASRKAWKVPAESGSAACRR